MKNLVPPRAESNPKVTAICIQNFLFSGILFAIRPEINIGNPKKMLGKWTRFEYFVNWTTENDGKFVIFNNGKKVMDYAGPTCSSKKLCLSKNNHYYGLYSLNNKDRGGLKSVEPATIYYRNVSRADKKEELIGYK